MKLLVMQSSPVPSYLVSLRPERRYQHPILEHARRMFAPSKRATETRSYPEICIFITRSMALD